MPKLDNDIIELQCVKIFAKTECNKFSEFELIAVKSHFTRKAGHRSALASLRLCVIAATGRRSHTQVEITSPHKQLGNSKSITRNRWHSGIIY